MGQHVWEFAEGTRVPRWLVVTVDCTAIFNWAATVVECGDQWEIAPRNSVREGTSPFLVRPLTERHRGAAVPTRPFVVSYDVPKPQSR